MGDAVVDVDILDLFAGTGALGIEALSRGGQNAVFVDNSQQALQLVDKNLDCCGFSDRATILCRDLSKSLAFLKKITPEHGFGLIFADPPYRRGMAVKTLNSVGKYNVLAESGQLVVEEDSDVELPRFIEGLEMFDRRTYGDTAVCFYRKEKVSRNE